MDKNTRIENITAMRCSLDWMLCSFVKQLQDDGQKHTHWEQTPKSAIWRCSYGHETSFEGIDDKSGIGDFGDWLRALRRCVALSIECFVFCKTVASSPRNPRFPIYRFSSQTAFRARVSIFKSGISGSGPGSTVWLQDDGQKHTHWEHYGDALLSRVSIECFVFCKTVARWWTKTQSTESPILFRSCEHETPFSDQKEASKNRGFRALQKHTHWEHYSDALLSRLNALFFCKQLQDDGQKHTHWDHYSDALLYRLNALFFWNSSTVTVATSTCKMMDKNTRIENITARRWSLDWMLCIL